MAESTGTNPPPKPQTRPFRVHDLSGAKETGQKLTMLTAYDYPTAKIFDAAGVDMLLVGDSLGNVMLGLDSTLPVTLDYVRASAAAVSRAAQRAFVVADLPFGTYEGSPQQALTSSVMLLQAGANAVKMEGGAYLTGQVELLVNAGIPVIGHLGFTPQAENLLGGKRVQGRDEAGAEMMVKDAQALVAAGISALVLEMIPASLAARITEVVSVPTIGIGAGPSCDGQVLVWTDIAGMSDFSPSFAKQFAPVGQALTSAAAGFIAEVRGGSFPSIEHYFAR